MRLKVLKVLAPRIVATQILMYFLINFLVSFDFVKMILSLLSLCKAVSCTSLLYYINCLGRNNKLKCLPGLDAFSTRRLLTHSWSDVCFLGQ